MQPHDLHFSQRVFKSENDVTHHTKPLLEHSSAPACRPKQYATWSHQSLDNAITAVESQGVSIRKAAEMYGIPKSTLYDHVSGRVEDYKKSGPSPYLSAKEEEELACFLIKCARMGYPHTRQQILSIVQRILDSKKIKHTVTHGWWERFRGRHPYLTLRTAVPLSVTRAMAQDPEALECYYNLLEETLHTYDIYDNPNAIFNCDETGLPLNPKPPKVVVAKGAKNSTYVSGDSKSQITILACTSAAGFAMPPYVIFDRKKLNAGLTSGEVPGTIYGLSNSGWMDTDLFQKWFSEHFLVYAPSCHPLILLMDGHASHFCPDMIRLAAEEEVILFTLPPNTTHLCQPLDKGPFAPLKMEWRKTVHNFLSKNPGRTVTRYDFSSLFAETWYRAMTIKNITSGFKITGVFPFDRDAVKLEQPKTTPKSKCVPFYDLSYSQRLNPTK